MRLSAMAVIAGIIVAASVLPQAASAAPVSIGVGIGVPGPMVGYPPPAYYAPGYYYPPTVYGPGVVVAPGYGWYGRGRGYYGGPYYRGYRGYAGYGGYHGYYHGRRR